MNRTAGSKRRSFGVVLCGWILALSFLFSFASQTDAALPQETKAQRDQRMAWWREARFGMFIHWGLYAIPAGVWNGKRINGIGEWIMFHGKIPISEYSKLVNQFNPPQFDARQWVSIARNAGMKYIVITSKHHDGFCLFDSKLTDYDVMSTPFKRDIMKELADECHRQGIKICWYHSILDWHHPDYLPRGKGSPRPWDTRPTKDANFDRYIEYMKGQLRELLTNYGQIGVLWFDGGWEHTPKELHSEEVVEMIREIQPQIIINDRIRIPQDFNTPEQYIPATGVPNRDWETCMTINDTWGYKSYDHNWKSTEVLIRNLANCASKGGNFLLNVGPTDAGTFPEPIVERLQAIGQWMRKNSESIYGTTASPFRRLSWGRCTVKPGRLFLHVFDWPKDKLPVPGLRNKVRKAYLLADLNHSPLPVTRTEENVLVDLPHKARDPIDTVVVLEIEGTPDVVAVPIKPRKDGSVVLEAMDGDPHGQRIRYETGREKGNIGFWSKPKDWVSWDFRIDQPGTFAVEITYACKKGSDGSQYEIAVGDQKLKSRVKATGTWKNYVTQSVGAFQLPTAGKFTLSVHPVKIQSDALMNLKKITLRMVKR